MSNSAPGDVVPMPTLLADASTNNVPESTVKSHAETNLAEVDPPLDLIVCLSKL